MALHVQAVAFGGAVAPCEQMVHEGAGPPAPERYVLAAQMQAAPEPDVEPAERPESKREQQKTDAAANDAGTGSAATPINDSGGGGSTEVFTNSNNRSTTMSDNTAGLIVTGNQYS